MPRPRSHVRRVLLSLTLATGMAAVPLATVLACSCGMATIPEYVGFADVVFTGTATAVEGPPPADIVSSADPVRYSFAVDQVFKGDLVEAEVVATTALDGASCGTSFGIDEQWLVFANFQDGQVWTGLCSGNVLLADEEAEAAVLAELGPPIAQPVPEPGAPEEAPASGETGAGFKVPLPIVLGIGGALLVAGVSAWAFLIEPRRRAS